MVKILAAEDLTYNASNRQVVKGPGMAGEGEVRGMTKYWGDASQVNRGPQGFLVDYGSNFRIDPHFHLVDQYQLFCRGSAKIGKHYAGRDSLTVHYTDSFTPYGPIVGEEDGFAFFNFRSRADIGAHLMPAQKDELLRRAGRTITQSTRMKLADAGPGITREELIAPHEDGLATIEIVAGPGVALPDEIVGGACRYELVLEGTLEVDGKQLKKDSCVLGIGGDLLKGRRAGPEGVHLLQAQLPHG